MAEWRIASTTDPGLTGVTDGSMPGEYIFQPPKNIAKNATGQVKAACPAPS